jgi:3-isopropylmalate dehydratase small subunit
MRAFTILQSSFVPLPVDLPQHTLRIDAAGASASFHINGYKKTSLLNGYDNTGFPPSTKGDIPAFENHPQ